MPSNYRHFLMLLNKDVNIILVVRMSYINHNSPEEIFGLKTG